MAIIGLLSSVVLASLNSARAKAKDAAIKTAINQYRNLIEQQSDGNYSGWHIGWAWASNSVSECSKVAVNSGYSFSYNSKGATAIAICTNILNNGGNLHLGVASDPANNYSIMASLSNGKYYCVGSSGGNSDTEIGDDWLDSGCFANP